MQLVIFKGIDRKKPPQGPGGSYFAPISLSQASVSPSLFRPFSSWVPHIFPMFLLAGDLPDANFFSAIIALKSGWMFKAERHSSPRFKAQRGRRGDQGSGFSSSWGGEGRPLGGFQVLSCLGTHNCHRKHVFLPSVNRPTYSVESSFDSLLNLFTVLRKSNRQGRGPCQRSSDLRGLYSR